ncbi:CVNH [Aspergillus sclerotialis]|uniref:CVNH n=1 Tax=Aspergillus sclerotialis TaxID=2070753 RepID=A0A3A2ZAJ0_9EURO|nr:CVNH [Aspergillus sclerotialis]
MSFVATAEEVRLEDDHVLVAQLQNEEGEMVDASIDLNECIGNNDGSFEWGGVNFSESAEDISFELEGDDQIPVLRARLNPAEGDPIDADINLAERISNQDGNFVFE